MKMTMRERWIPMIRKISTKDMSREEWLSYRNKSIGGSDAGAILGLNPYKSPYALWAEKTGKVIQEDISDKESVRLGNDLEQYVAERWMEKTGKKLRRENNILYNSNYPFAHANIDRAVVGEPDAGFEAKTTSSYDILKQCREGKFPDTWYCQVCHYMMVTGAKRWYLGVLVFGHGFFEFTIERNDAEIESLEKAEADFWSKVTSDTPPTIDGAESTLEAVKAMNLHGEPVSVDLSFVRDHVDMYSAVTRQIKELEKIRDQHKASIMSFMRDAETGSTDNVKITWKSQERSTFKRDLFERDHGKIPSQYFEKTSSRVFRFTETNKKGELL